MRRLLPVLILALMLPGCLQGAGGTGTTPPADAGAVADPDANGILPPADQVATSTLAPTEAPPAPETAPQRPPRAAGNGPMLWSAERAVQAPPAPKPAPQPTPKPAPQPVKANPEPPKPAVPAPAPKPAKAPAPSAAPEPEPQLLQATVDDLPAPATKPGEPKAEPESAVPAAPEVPQALKSASQKACEKKGGTWAATGSGATRACVKPTRDAGKSCRRARDCDGLCLARSRTCAPLKPLFGCHDILQDDGSQVTLCID
jgi:outer membrane biosynthesis protein TonB